MIPDTRAPGLEPQAVPRPRAARPPRQDRSRKTYDALLDAAERLLRRRAWEAISTVEITREAGCSNGAIYGRFDSKDDILVALYARHDARLKAELAEQRRPAERNSASLEDLLRSELEPLVASMRENRWLLRAMGLLSRAKPELITGEMRQERKALFDRVGARFLEIGGIGGPDPRRRIELAIFFAATAVREAILYEGPHARTLELDDRELIDSLVHMSMAFLTSPTLDGIDS